VVADVSASGVDETWCLGDLVGYGAQPNECVALAAEKCDFSLIGNHDLVVIDKISIAEFSLNAGLAAKWTMEELGDEARAYLEPLSPADERHDVGLYHGSPRDPVWEYVLSTLQAGQCMNEMGKRVGAVGHSHVALWFHRGEDGEVLGDHAPEGTEKDLSEGDWILNPGGVGQPRDGDPRAAWLLLDTDSWTATWRRVEYPIDQAADAIREAGLPAALAERLYYGQ
jgi:diadenosine tetraphosphatase ApaH/serine/threonine PP2A family protein phosphatase